MFLNIFKGSNIEKHNLSYTILVTMNETLSFLLHIMFKLKFGHK